jgi:glucose-6-phosphate 1-dehydrogenase
MATKTTEHGIIAWVDFSRPSREKITAHTIVIFGASGDLTSRKLVPVLYELFRKKRLPENTRIVGFSRTRFTDESWREKLTESTVYFVGKNFEQVFTCVMRIS